MPMENINILLTYLRLNGWHMTSFPFYYKKFEYIVLFEDLNNLNLTNDDRYSVLLTFIDMSDINRRLTVKANSFCFKFNVVEFRKFFNIAYTENLGDVFQEFYEYFNKFVPAEANQNVTNEELQIIVNQLNRRDNDNNMCCYAVKRNPQINGKQCHRTIFNSEKCRRLKPALYIEFEHDDTISFCFREENELPVAEILKNFAHNEIKNIKLS